MYEHHVSRIQISLDGASMDSCRRLRLNDLAFERAVSALKILREFKFKDVNIAFCPT